MAFAIPLSDLSRDRTVKPLYTQEGTLSYTFCLFKNPGVPLSPVSLQGILLN